MKCKRKHEKNKVYIHKQNLLNQALIINMLNDMKTTCDIKIMDILLKHKIGTVGATL